ncbi:MAG TPA: hypothetical protein PLK80_17715, partial [bacterium]|nr:hypothetical protein [bacterium]
EEVNKRVVELYNSIPRDVAGFETIEPHPAGPPPVDPEPEPEIESVDAVAQDEESIRRSDAEPE